MKVLNLFCLVVIICVVRSFSEPPPGPDNVAICPVSGTKFTITKSSPSVSFKYGQKLFFSSPDAAKLYVDSPRDYWLSPHEKPLAGMDGKRGLPDLRNTTVRCANTGENITVAMDTPRVIHRYGQNVYFCCFGCVTQFWTDPSSMILSL